MGKLIRRFPRIITDKELKKILQTITKSDLYTKRNAGPFLRIRDASLQCFMYFTGLRPNEALSLKWSDIDKKHRIINVHPESNKERNGLPAILTRPAAKYLKLYELELKRMGMWSEWLFPSLWTWKPMTVDAMGKRFQLLCKEAGISKVSYYNHLGKPKYELSPYGYRRSFASAVYDATGDIKAVQEMIRVLTLTAVHRYVYVNPERRVQIADAVFR